MSTRRDADVERVRALALSSGGRVGIVALPVAGRPRFVLDLGYATAGSSEYPRLREARSRLAIDLAPRHPFMPPVTTVLTPVFHPHVFPSGVVCVGTRWLPGEGMDLFVARVARLLAFDPRLMNPMSIANAAANAWYRAALARHPDAFPTDAAALALDPAAPTGTSTPPDAAARVLRRCPHCPTMLRLPAGRAGSVRCPSCGRDFDTST